MPTAPLYRSKRKLIDAIAIEQEPVAARIAANISKLLRNKACDVRQPYAKKNRQYAQTEIRRLRRTTRFEHNDRDDAETRSCPRKRNELSTALRTRMDK